MNKIILFLLLIGFANIGFAEDVCSFLEKEKLDIQKKVIEHAQPSTWEIIKSYLFQDQFKAKKIKIESTLVDNVVFLPKKNVIFTFSIPDSLIEKNRIRKNEYEKILNSLLEQKPKLQKLLDQKTIDGCQRLNKSMNFDLDSFIEKWKKFLDFNDVLAYNMDVMLPEISQEFIKESKSDKKWTVIRAARIESLIDLLNDRSVENLIIVTHGSDNGAIYDSNLRQIPASIFRNLSPSIRSIGLYNCYTEKTLIYYNLEKILHESPSFWTERYIYRIGDNLFNKQAPTHGLKTFLKSIDLDLSKNLGIIDTTIEETKISAQCRVSVISELGENYGFYVGGQFLGTLRDYENIFNYPCVYSTKDQITVQLKNIQALEEGKAQTDNTYIEFLDEPFVFSKSSELKNETGIFMKLIQFQK